jgi:hypothetical protein
MSLGSLLLGHAVTVGIPLEDASSTRTSLSGGKHHTGDELVDLVCNLVGYLER